MARKVRNASLDSRQARTRLKPRGKPYWTTIERGLHVGYRRLSGRAGSWCIRHYLGHQSYQVEGLGIADDLSDADGSAIFDFWQAQNVARQRMAKRARARSGDCGPLTVKVVIENYLEWMEGSRKSSKETRQRAEALIIPALGNLQIGETDESGLTTDAIVKWHRDLAKHPAWVRTSSGAQQRYRELTVDDEAVRKRRATANRVLTILKAALNHSFKRRKITGDDVWRAVEPFKSVEVARVRYLTVAEAKRLINASDPDFRLLLHAALQTGARYGELARLCAGDFNPDSGTVTIARSKNGKARHVVLTDEGVAIFRQLAAGRDGLCPLLPRSNGKAWKKSEQNRPMQIGCQRAGIRPAISFHVLRHTWASLSVMNNMPLMVVAKNLGHADTRMVEKHYGHLSPDFISDAIRAAAPRFNLPLGKVRAVG